MDAGDHPQNTGAGASRTGRGSARAGHSPRLAGGNAPGGTGVQLVRFAAVGALATAIHYVLLIGLVETMNVGPVAATVLGSIAGALVAYAGNRRYTFNSGVPHARGLPRFLLVASAGLILNASIMALLSGPLGIHYLVAQIVATGVVLLWNFVANRHWTFGDPTRD